MAMAPFASLKKVFLSAVMLGLVSVPSNAFVLCPADAGRSSLRFARSAHPFSLFEPHLCTRTSNFGKRVRVPLHSSNIKSIPDSERHYTELPNVVLDAVAKAAKAAVEKSTGEGTESSGAGIPYFLDASHR